MKEFEEILSIAKCSVSLTINNHRDYYESVSQHLQEQTIDINILNKMIELDTIVHLQVYPNTPIGFYSVYHYDLETAIKLVLEILNQTSN